MKIIQINNVFPLGSTGKIVNDLHEYYIHNSIESCVCYGNGKKVSAPGIYKISNLLFQKIGAFNSRLTGLMYGDCFFQTIYLTNLIKKEKPDIVHIHCINGHIVNIYNLVKWLNKNNYCTVLTLHSEFMYTGSCGHSLDCERWKSGCGRCPRLKKETKSIFFDNTHLSWMKMRNAFDGFKNLKVISVSPWLMNRAMDSPILNNFEHKVITNGLDTNIFKIYDTNNLKKKLGLENKIIVFHATPFFSNDVDHIKGGYYIIELAKMLKENDINNVQFLIAGSYDKNLKLPNNITMIGLIKDQELLAKYYSMSQLFLLTSKKETFSMTTAEALCCGTPVIGFKAGGPESIAINDYSEFVEYGDIDSLFKCLLNWIDKKFDKKKISNDSKKIYDKNVMALNYCHVYNELCGRKLKNDF